MVIKIVRKRREMRGVDSCLQIIDKNYIVVYMYKTESTNNRQTIIEHKNKQKILSQRNGIYPIQRSPVRNNHSSNDNDQ